MTKRRVDQSQLDWLWDTYGEKEISSDPSFADNGDILDKKGVSALVQKMIGSVLASLEIQESNVNDEKLDVIGITHNGVRNTMFSIDKEDHLVKVVVRMSSQADIDAGNAEHINKPFVELDMFSGKAFGFCLENMVLTGANTSTITTLVQGGYINCELIIAENNDKAITCKATNNGLYVGLNLAQKEGQVGLEKVDNGLVVRLKWDDNKDVMFKEMTWAKQSVDTGNNGDTNGIIYFISDKGYISLNGIKYGVLPEDAIRYTFINEGENKTIHLGENDSISSGKLDSIVNLIKMNNGAVIVGDASVPLRLFGSNDHVRFNGKKLTYLDEFNDEQDRVNIELGKLDGKIDGAVQTMTELINTFTESVNKEIDDEIKPSIEKLETLTADLNTSILNHIKNADEQFAKIKEETDRLQKADETLNNNMVEGFNTINKNVSDGFNTINGAIDDELRPNIKKNADDIKTTNETLAMVNQNLADSVAKINEAFTTGFNTINGAINDEIRPNIEKNKKDIETLSKNTAQSINTLNTNMANGFKAINDCIDGILSPGIESNKEAIAKLEERVEGNKSDLDEDIKLLNETVATANQNMAESINRINQNVADGFNTINGGINNEIRPAIEENKDAIFTEADERKLADKQLGSRIDQETEVRVMMDEAIADKVTEVEATANNSVQWTDMSAEDAEDRKSIELKNFDMLASYTSDGQKIPIAVVSRGNRLDLGASVVPVNLKGSATNPTYNGNNIALASDIIAATGSIKLEKQDDETYVLKVGETVAGEIKFVDKYLKDIIQDGDVVSFIYSTEEGDKSFGIDLSKYIDTNLILEETKRATEAEEAIEKKVDEKVDWTDVATGDNPGRKSILLKNHDTILGKDTEGNAYNIAMISKWNKVDLGTVQLPFNMNGSEYRPTYNDTKEVALLEDINANMGTVNIEKQDDHTYVLKVGDRIAGEINLIDYSVVIEEEKERAMAAEKANADEIAKKVGFNDVSTEDNPGRKAIILENHDVLLGKKTDGSTVCLAMLSKWDKADYGSVTVPFNMNGSEERPTYNDDKELALMDDVNAIEIPEKLPNPNALTIRYNGIDAFSYDGSKAETGNFIVNAETIPIADGETKTIADKLSDMDANISRLVYGDVDVQKYLSDANYTAQMLFKLEQSYLDDLGNPENVNGRPYSEENKPVIGRSYIVYAKFDESFVFHYDMYEINAGSSFMLKTLFDCMNSYNTEMNTRISNIEKDVAALKGGN